jgi:hypothetical protein
MADGGGEQMLQMLQMFKISRQSAQQIEPQAAKRATQLTFSFIPPRLLGASGRPKLNSEIGRFTGS